MTEYTDCIISFANQESRNDTHIFFKSRSNHGLHQHSNHRIQCYTVMMRTTTPTAFLDHGYPDSHHNTIIMIQ